MIDWSQDALRLLTQWTAFYSVVGEAAATLTGLTFIIITLLDRKDRPNNPEGVSIFTTPTVVHFGAALSISAVLLAPWSTPVAPATVLGCISAYGLYRMLHVMHRARRLPSYSPDAEDWLWYAFAPFAAYGTVFGGAITLCAYPRTALYLIAAAAVLLIVIGIRNAWDIVTFITVEENEITRPPQE